MNIYTFFMDNGHHHTFQDNWSIMLSGGGTVMPADVKVGDEFWMSNYFIPSNHAQVIRIEKRVP